MAETLGQFLKEMPKMAREIERRSLRAWQAGTILVEGQAKELAPESRESSLVKSIQLLKAKIGADGLKSAVLAKVPYAAVLESGMRNGKPIKLKSAGELSYYINGAKVYKKKKGVKGYMEKAANKFFPGMVKDVDEIIAEVWKG